MTMTNDEHICTIEEAAALKFAAVSDGPHKMPDVETWVRKAKEEYVVLSLCMPILNSSDADLERKIRSHEDTEGFIKALQELTENAMCLEGRYQAGAETMASVYARLLTVLARLVDAEPLAGRAS